MSEIENEVENMFSIAVTSAMSPRTNQRLRTPPTLESVP